MADSPPFYVNPFLFKNRASVTERLVGGLRAGLENYSYSDILLFVKNFVLSVS